MNTTMPIRLLWLLQLSDTALPIGALNHSFGLETLTAEESLSADGLESFLHDYLQEVSALEIHFCGAAYRLGVEARDRFPIQRWLDLNTKLSAFKLARESRIASATLGRRFLRLVNGLANSPDPACSGRRRAANGNRHSSLRRVWSGGRRVGN